METIEKEDNRNGKTIESENNRTYAIIVWVDRTSGFSVISGTSGTSLLASEWSANERR